MGGKINILNEKFQFFFVEQFFKFLSQIGRDLRIFLFLLCATVEIIRPRCGITTHATAHDDTGCQQNVMFAAITSRKFLLLLMFWLRWQVASLAFARSGISPRGICV
jgi:hypothetical protein